MSDECYLYIIGPAGRSKPIKIGLAADPELRLRQLQTGNPMKLCIMHKYWAFSREQASYWEILAHKLFEDKRLAGEWFDVTALEVHDNISHWRAEREPKAPPKRREFASKSSLDGDFEPFHPEIPVHLRGKPRQQMTPDERIEYWRCFDLPAPPYGFDDWYIVGSPSSGVLGAFPIVGFLGDGGDE